MRLYELIEGTLQRGQVKDSATDVTMGFCDLDREAALRAPDVNQPAMLRPGKSPRQCLGHRPAPGRHRARKRFAQRFVRIELTELRHHAQMSLRLSGSQRRGERAPIHIEPGYDALE